MLLTHREGKGQFHTSMSKLLSCLLPTMIEAASHNPYPITSKAPLIHSPPPPNFGGGGGGGGGGVGGDSDRAKSLNRKRGGKKPLSGGNLEMLDIGGSLGHLPQQQQQPTQSMPRGVKGHSTLTSEGRSKGGGGGGGGGGGDKTMKRSLSSDAGFSGTAGCYLPPGFSLPEQVLIFPVLEKLEEGASQWDFYLLTEEEVSHKVKNGQYHRPKSNN